jgi:hypothetical protein
MASAHASTSMRVRSGPVRSAQQLPVGIEGLRGRVDHGADQGEVLRGCRLRDRRLGLTHQAQRRPVGGPPDGVDD